MRIAKVALPVPLPHSLSYVVPEELASVCVRGARVVCPLGARRELGVVLDVVDEEAPPGKRMRAVAEVVDGLGLPEELLSFLRELSAYYLAPIGEVTKLALPPEEHKTLKAVEMRPTLFSTKKGIGGRIVTFAEPTQTVDAEREQKLSASAKAMLAKLRAAGKMPLARLADEWASARTMVKRLEALEVVRVFEAEAPDDPFFDVEVPRDVEKAPTAAQEAARLAITRALEAKAPSAFLLHGVTGSGKTEVYLRAIGEAKRLGKGAIVLVPEIALTPQLVSRFRARFGDGVAVLHSGLTPKERHKMWHSLRSGGVDVAIGARSALFAPTPSLGLVIVDEEHDPSFKQEEGVRYHARDMALLRAQRAGAVCVLGTATPSLESEYLARTGKITRLALPERARAQELPKVTVVDLKRIGAGPTGDKRLSLPLYRALEKNLEAKGQTILFLNRRGFSPALRCETCGAVASCPNCSVALTFHKTKNVLRCHTCDHEEPVRTACAACKSPDVALEGVGTERLEETLAAAFPTAKVARLDRDVASGKDAEKILEKMRSREIDILVGTQMVTKGHDLPEVTLVGVIAADAALSMPDFRASERAFQLLVQVAGRAGRGESPGQVIVQTYDPKHPSVRFGVSHDTNGFVEAELANRRELGYPPYSRMVLVRVDAVDPDVALEGARVLAEVARAVAGDTGKLDVLGPSPAPLARLRNRHRFRVMLRGSDRATLRAAALAVSRALPTLPHAVRAHVDVDPVHML
ncbi:MAG: primosomal protein N' [Myxococcales bacterium]|nr:primosomal protein N' [Myxococcales bacterium]